jgi:hypothetical protein
MTLPYGLFDDRVFGGRKAVTTNPFDWRSRAAMPTPEELERLKRGERVGPAQPPKPIRKQLPAPVVTTAKAPSWEDYRSGAVDRARDAALVAPRLPDAQAIANKLRENFRTEFAKSPTTRTLTKHAAQLDMGMAGVLGALDPQLTTQGVRETAEGYREMTGGSELSAAETFIPAGLGGLAGNVAAYMTGTRAVTAGVQAAGRRFGSQALMNAGKTIEKMRDAQGLRALPGRAIAELAPAVPINIAQGLTDEEGGEMTAMASEAFGSGELAKKIRAQSPTTRRLLGAAENQAMDFLGFGAIEAGRAGLAGARAGSKIVREDILRPMAETEEAVAISRRLMEKAEELGGRLSPAARAAIPGLRADAAGAAVGGVVGGATADDDQTLEGAVRGALMGALGSRAMRGASAPGLSTNNIAGPYDPRSISDGRVTVPKRGAIREEARVDAPFPAYSRVLQTVAESKQERGGLDHWRGILTSPKSGIRPAELEQTGVLDWIASQKEPRMVGEREVMVQRSVTKQEIMDYHRSKLPELGSADRGVPRDNPEEVARLERAQSRYEATNTEYVIVSNSR